jgi:2-keto-4-pentenoate hydratase/2-oxohepta-3-ene-1,7-dioic acid hydratase in catechol pathway
MIKYCRYIINDVIKFGRVEDNEVFALDREPWYDGKETGETISLSKIRILSPSEPRVIIGLGDSYSTAWEGKDPPRSVRWFIKPPGSAASWNDDIILPAVLNEVKVEVELVIVIGSITKNTGEEEAGNSIFGYTIGNDIVGTTDSYYRITNEKTGYNEKLLATGLKICDGFAPFGPFIYKNIEWHDKTGKLKIIDKEGNRRILYENSLSGLLYSPAKIVSDLSKVLTLFPGDIIMTGTTRSFPAHPGETVEVSIDGMGVLINKITVLE